MKTLNSFLTLVLFTLFLSLGSAKADFGQCDNDPRWPWEPVNKIATLDIELDCGLTAKVEYKHRVSYGYYHDIWMGDIQLGNDPSDIQALKECLEYYQDKYPGQAIDVNFLIERIKEKFLAAAYDNGLIQPLNPENLDTCITSYRLQSASCYQATWTANPGNLLDFWGVLPADGIIGIIYHEDYTDPFDLKVKYEGGDELQAIWRNLLLPCNNQVCCEEMWQACNRPNPQDKFHPIIEWTLLDKRITQTGHVCDLNNLINPHCQNTCED